MEADTIAEVTNLPKERVKSVMAAHKHDAQVIERGVHEFLETGGGIFKDAGAEAGPAWASVLH